MQMVKMKCLISEPGHIYQPQWNYKWWGANEANFRVISYTCVKAATKNENQISSKHNTKLSYQCFECNIIHRSDGTITYHSCLSL